MPEGRPHKIKNILSIDMPEGSAILNSDNMNVTMPFDELCRLISDYSRAGYMEAVKAYEPASDNIRSTEMSAWLRIMQIDRRKFRRHDRQAEDMKTNTNAICAACRKAHWGLNGRYCRQLKMYVEHRGTPLCTTETENRIKQ